MLSSLNQVSGRHLAVRPVKVEDKTAIMDMVGDYYLNHVDPDSADDPGYAGQGAKIFAVHKGVIDANLRQATSDPHSTFEVVTDQDTGGVVATSALLSSSLNGDHQRPADVGELSYFYQAPGTPPQVAQALIADIAGQARGEGMHSLYTTARRHGMDERVDLLRSAGFAEVTDAGRVAELAPPILRSPHTIVMEKPL